MPPWFLTCYIFRKVKVTAVEIGTLTYEYQSNFQLDTRSQYAERLEENMLSLLHSHVPLLSEIILSLKINF